jgi:[ribosomal protein S5]-alanine N-acetyltransferase
VQGPRVHLERPSARREREYLDAAHRSRALHRGFVTTPTRPDEYRDYLRRARRTNQESFFVVDANSRALVGVVNLNDIVHYAQQTARLGYYAFAPYAGRGFMHEGVSMVVSLAFRDLGLHRLEANIQPSNERSIALVRSLGFRREGTARGFLKVGGRWRDHERWALLKDEWCGWRAERQPRRLRAGVTQR